MRGRGARVSKSSPASLFADVIVEASKEDLEERWLELRPDKGYGATRILAGIDE
jgi:hypothetical protein